MGPNGLDKILTFFPDHKPEDKESMYIYFKESVEKQNIFRELIHSFLDHT